jgi:hypothetical protein
MLSEIHPIYENYNLIPFRFLLHFKYCFLIFLQHWIGIEKGNSYWENEEIFRWKAHINTRNFNVKCFKSVIINQQRVNVRDHTVKTVPGDILGLSLPMRDIINFSLQYFFFPSVFQFVSPFPFICSSPFVKMFYWILLFFISLCVFTSFTF